MRKSNSGAAVYLLFVACFSTVVSTSVKAQSSYPFVESDFEVPEKLETREFRLRMLTVDDFVKDSTK